MDLDPIAPRVVPVADGGKDVAGIWAALVPDGESEDVNPRPRERDIAWRDAPRVATGVKRNELAALPEHSHQAQHLQCPEESRIARERPEDSLHVPGYVCSFGADIGKSEPASRHLAEEGHPHPASPAPRTARGRSRPTLDEALSDGRAALSGPSHRGSPRGEVRRGVSLPASGRDRGQAKRHDTLPRHCQRGERCAFPRKRTLPQHSGTGSVSDMSDRLPLLPAAFLALWPASASSVELSTSMGLGAPTGHFERYDTKVGLGPVLAAAVEGRLIGPLGLRAQLQAAFLEGPELDLSPNHVGQFEGSARQLAL